MIERSITYTNDLNGSEFNECYYGNSLSFG
jgi:hypothetical protein